MAMLLKMSGDTGNGINRVPDIKCVSLYILTIVPKIMFLNLHLRNLLFLPLKFPIDLKGHCFEQGHISGIDLQCDYYLASQSSTIQGILWYSTCLRPLKLLFCLAANIPLSCRCMFCLSVVIS